MAKWPTQANRIAFYGDPTKNNAAWQAANLVQVEVPWAVLRRRARYLRSASTTSVRGRYRRY